MKAAVGLAAVLLVLVGGWYGCRAATAPAPSMLNPSPIPIADDPIQIDLDGAPAIPVTFNRGSAELTPRARYRLTGKVCGLNHLKRSKFEDLIPYDLCVAWGRLATEDMHGKVTYKHDSLRLVWVHADRDAPVDWPYASTHFSNSHLLTTDPRVRKALGRLDKWDDVEITGQLVDAEIAIDGRTVPWKTSMVRNDGGLGACETILVRSLRANGKVYGDPLVFD